ncbi:MAG: ATP-binding protein [Saprospiraceae bacterium]|nr:ATP-binding protein [Saprospiraceae bacterium]
MATVLVGRKDEINILDECYDANRSHFVAVYGRRRVGKTFLIKSHFEGRLFFTFTGISNASLQQQITNFNVEISQQLAINNDEYVANWFSAFQLLRDKISKSKIKRRLFLLMSYLG